MAYRQHKDSKPTGQAMGYPSPFVVPDSLECDSSLRCLDALQTGGSTDSTSTLITKHNW